MERNFAKLHEDVCFGRAGGKVIWQPRIGCWIDDKLFESGRLPGVYEGMSKAEIYRELDCSARVYEYNSCFYPIYDDTLRTWSEQDGDVIAHYIQTPIGTVSQRTQASPNSWARRTVKEWVADEEELKIFTYIEQHTGWGYSQETFDQVRAEWGNLGAPSMFMPRVSVQRLYIDLMGVEQAVYALADYPETVEAYFAALRESQLKLIDVINASPIQIINFGDNVHSGTLPPALFERYVLPEYQLRCEKLHSAGKFVSAHFDGDNRSLLGYYRQTGLDGIEAITPVPQGDVTPEDVFSLEIPQNRDGRLPHGFMYLRLLDLCGFENAMVMFAEEGEEIETLIRKVLTYNRIQIESVMDSFSEWATFGDDLGIQTGLAIGAERWRKYLKPCYREMYGMIRRAHPNTLIYMHTDGCIHEIMPDLQECGVDMINPQFRANGLDNLVRVCRSEHTIPINLDLDRQMFPFATRSEIFDHVGECVEALYLPQGGLSLNVELNYEIPMENCAAILEALEKYRHYRG